MNADQLTVARETLAWLDADATRQNGQYPHWEQDVWLRTITTDDGGESCMYFAPGQAGQELAHDCGTRCCVAGYAVLAALDKGLTLPSRLSRDWDDAGAKLLGLSHPNAVWMFAGERTRDELTAALDHALRTSEWPDSLGDMISGEGWEDIEADQ